MPEGADDQPEEIFPVHGGLAADSLIGLEIAAFQERDEKCGG